MKAEKTVFTLNFNYRDIVIRAGSSAVSPCFL